MFGYLKVVECMFCIRDRENRDLPILYRIFSKFQGRREEFRYSIRYSVEVKKIHRLRHWNQEQKPLHFA